MLTIHLLADRNMASYVKTEELGSRLMALQVKSQINENIAIAEIANTHKTFKNLSQNLNERLNKVEKALPGVVKKSHLQDMHIDFSNQLEHVNKKCDTFKSDLSIIDQQLKDMAGGEPAPLPAPFPGPRTHDESGDETWSEVYTRLGISVSVPLRLSWLSCQIKRT